MILTVAKEKIISSACIHSYFYGWYIYIHWNTDAMVSILKSVLEKCWQVSCAADDFCIAKRNVRESSYVEFALLSGFRNK